jgi:MFS family permease
MSSTPSTRWAVVALIISASIVSAFQIGKVPVALGELRADLGFGLVAAGWAISMFNMIGVIGGMPAGAVIGRFGPERVAVSGLLIFAAAGILGAMADNTGTLLVSRFLEGVGFLMAHVAVPSLILRHSASQHQKLIFGAWGAYMGGGQAIIMVLSPPILEAVGWRGLWIANAVLLIVLACALAVATQVTRTRGAADKLSPGGFLRDLRETLLSGGPSALAICFGCYALNYIAVVGFLPTIFSDTLGLTPRNAAVLTALVALANATGNVTGGILLHYGFSRWKLLVTSHVVMGLCSIGIFADGIPFFARYGLCLLSMGVGGILPASIVSAIAIHAPRPHLVAMTNGLVTQGTGLGQVIGPPLVAFVAILAGGWQWSPLVVVSFAVAGIALAFYIRGLESRAQTGNHP